MHPASSFAGEGPRTAVPQDGQKSDEAMYKLCEPDAH
jgi:hypothetical protein